MQQRAAGKEKEENNCHEKSHISYAALVVRNCQSRHIPDIFRRTSKGVSFYRRKNRFARNIYKISYLPI